MATDQFVEMARNLARYHREHEKFYARAPLEQGASLQRTSVALRALAKRWSTTDASEPEAASPFSGAEDLNDERATELAGILFMEGEHEPAEITRIKRELRSASEENEQAGEWLGSAMETSWGVAEALLGYPDLANLLSERHRIISNDWHAEARRTQPRPCSGDPRQPRFLPAGPTGGVGKSPHHPRSSFTRPAT